MNLRSLNNTFLNDGVSDKENMKNNLNELTDKLSSLINKMKLERSGFNSEFSNL